MDRTVQHRHLAQAEEHIRLGAQNISDQQLRIEHLQVCGHDTVLARKLLETFQVTQGQHIAHRDYILKKLGR